MSRFQVYFFVISIIIIVFALFIKVHFDNDDSINYFKSLNLTLTGIVKDKQVVSHDRGLLYVDVLKSSLAEYDIRQSGANYYCVINKDKAEIIEGGLSEIHIGDSIVINSHNRSFEFFRGGKLIKKSILRLTYFNLITRQIKKIHRL